MLDSPYVTHAQMEKIAAPWRTHASIASWYLWRAADEAKTLARPARLRKPKQ